MIQWLSQTNPEIFSNKNVLVRLDVNVPIQEDGTIRDTDQERIIRSRRTIDFLVTAGAHVTIISHIGRNSEETLGPVARVMNIPLYPLGTPRVDLASPVAILENLRSDVREEQGDALFAQELVQGYDFFINDAFAACHRRHTSIVEIPKLLPSFGGFQLEQEINYLQKVFQDIHPALLIIGGAKFETKLPVIDALLEKVDHIFIGGALANNFYQARGYEIGRSLVDQNASLDHLVYNNKIILSHQVIIESESGTFSKSIDQVTYDEKIVDIDPAGIREYASIIKNAQLIIWNGPMGNYENRFIQGTESMANMIATRSHETISIIGGGDSVSVIEELGIKEQFSFISTGGGAMLEYLAQGTLPGLQAIDINN